MKMLAMHASIASGLMLFTLLLGCASHNPPADDPLKNTKRLVSKGHSDLYFNGAFHVPHTNMALIPAGPSAMELGMELIGLRARQSFVSSLKNARDSIYIVANGTKKSYQLAENIHQDTDEVAQYIMDYSRPNSKLLIYKAYPRTKHIIGASWNLAGETAKNVAEFGDDLASRSVQTGQRISETTEVLSAGAIGGSWKLAKGISANTSERSSQRASYARDEFVQGYAALPGNLSTRLTAVTDAVSLTGFASAFDKSLQYRESRSQFYTDIIMDASDNYAGDIKESFQKAAAAFEEVDDTGISLATLKAVRWVLQGVFWDSLLKPVGAAAMGTVGYLTVNTVTFPVMLVARSTVPIAEIAVKVTWNTAGAFYDVVAPTAIAATASLFSVTELAVGQSAAAATVVTGTTLGGASYVVGKGSAAVVSASGYAAGKTVKYVGVPLSAAGIAVTGTATGVVVGGASATAGGSLLVAGETGAVGTQVIGNVVAGTTLVAGTGVSVMGATGIGVYELAKAVAVPTGYSLGGGIVLGYGSTSQLAAHSILAVADASYLVLSLEGPRWVLLAVKGDLVSDDDLLPGTVLDLEKMQQAGEAFYYLPVSDEEMKKVVESVPEDLPRLLQE